MTGTGNGTIWKIAAACLFTGFVSFWSGYALKSSADGKMLEDHEARLRVVEKAVLGIDVMRTQLADIKDIVQGLERAERGIN